MNELAQWMSDSALNAVIKVHAHWLMPTIQTFHILSIAIVMGAVYMVCFRVLGLAAMDQTLRQVNRRFAPWSAAALLVLAVTGVLMIFSEPPRELASFSFWAKMILLAIGIVVALAFGFIVSRHEDAWDDAFARRPAVRLAAVGALVVWLGVILMGRLIAYDHVWGAFARATR